jgi:UDP-N-acetyl-D-mannosaminuronate dehydrogenase
MKNLYKKNTMKLAIIGLGYVGIPLAHALGWKYSVELQQGTETNV